VAPSAEGAVGRRPPAALPAPPRCLRQKIGCPYTPDIEDAAT
jgi:hypothetical protein